MSAPKVADNEPFHPNILTLKGLQKLADGSGSTLSRGYIVTADQPGSKVTKYHKVKFLYNPSTLQTNYSLDSGSAILPPYVRNPADTGQYKLLLNQQISFSLLFDRTYELYDSDPKWRKGSGSPGNIGVEYDVAAFKKLVGIYDSPTLDTNNTDVSHINPSMVANGGVMLYTPVYIYFGDVFRSLRFYGVIQSMEIDYTHWTQQMIPQRATVALSVSLLPNPTNSSSTGTGWSSLDNTGSITVSPKG